MATKINIKKTA